jgi:hypothetical protein
MRKALAVILLLFLATPALAKQRHAPRHPARQVAQKHRVAHPRRVRLGLVPHHKGVANLFWSTKPIDGERQDPFMDNTVHKSIPIN